MICRKAYKARHVGYEQAGLPGRGSGSEGRGDEAISGRKPSKKGPKRQESPVWEPSFPGNEAAAISFGKATLHPGPLARSETSGPEHSPEAPQGLAKVTRRTLSGVPGMSPCNILTLPPQPPPGAYLLGVRATCRGPAEFLQDPQPRGKGQHPSSTMSTTDWDPECTDTSQDPNLLSTCRQSFPGLPCSL